MFRRAGGGKIKKSAESIIKYCNEIAGRAKISDEI
jgi:hypothetical protein